MSLDQDTGKGRASPSCDVVIPTWQAGDGLSILLQALNQQTIKPDRIVIFDSSSTDNTVEIANSFEANVVVIKQSEFNHGGTRNRAASLCHSDVIVFMTQDAIPDNEFFLEELLGPLHGEVGLAYARQIAYPDASPPEVFSRIFNYPNCDQRRKLSDVSVLGVKAYFFSNVASAVRRFDFERLGGFPDRLPMNEDMVFCARALQDGMSVAYVSSAVVRHSHNYSIMQQARRYFDIGAFFADQGHLLPSSNTGGEGLRFALGQLRYLVCRGHFLWALRAPIELAAKWISFKAGQRYSRLPRRLVLAWAMHPMYFRNL